MLQRIVKSSLWNTWGVLVGRLIIAGVFLMALSFKVMGIEATAGYIASAGIPFSLPLAWLAVIFEALLVFAFVTGAYFRQAAFLAIFYILFLGFAFHGPSHWTGNQTEFGFFVDHFTFAAGLIFMVAHGPANAWKLRWGNAH
jgi:putative oxidoreductase